MLLDLKMEWLVEHYNDLFIVKVEQCPRFAVCSPARRHLQDYSTGRETKK